MRIFRDYTFKWWQIGLLKLDLLFFGIVIGYCGQRILQPYLPAFFVLGLILGFYLLYISFSRK